MMNQSSNDECHQKKREKQSGAIEVLLLACRCIATVLTSSTPRTAPSEHQASEGAIRISESGASSQHVVAEDRLQLQFYHFLAFCLFAGGASSDIVFFR